ncbi:GNAT family N-acetyltransferase [uncultured Sphingomonas sp.]|mgnify:CR=1 FL=1|uniref:GNAT family N-acetyltransferase n=1 Tax=uncultured Sphingomonas sp. TaxID=158754 RepID=UPI00260CE220|nr:N-acetyltransferase [uncultured Sphingomonas sp.]
MTITVRPARAEDVAAIDALLRASFPAPDEATLVRDLCIEGDMVLTLVAQDEDQDAFVGMIAFSRMDVGVGGKAVPSVALAPLAVAPAWRRQGVAEALVRAGHDRLEAEGVVLSFVLGEPEYYGRFGYDAAVARNFASPYAGDYFMALPLQGGLLPCGVREEARHAPAFARLGS